MGNSNVNLNRAKAKKNDEFYTFLEDIEKELINYKEFLEDKIVYCNCDNPKKSKFWDYFYNNFKDLKLKKIVFTYLDDTESIKYEYDGENITTLKLTGNGDFRSDECVDILKECDVVVTNPPFSLFISFAAQLIEYNKKFIIISSKNAVTYKNIIKLFQENLIWYGKNDVKKFLQPDNSIKIFNNITWLTNIEEVLSIKKNDKTLILTNSYYKEDGEPNTEKYQKYDNYDAINVDKVKDIPYDYYGIMGVPITFLDYYPYSQFKIIGADYEYAEPIIIDNKKHTGRFYVRENVCDGGG